jgi:hypothetical protein
MRGSMLEEDEGMFLRRPAGRGIRMPPQRFREKPAVAQRQKES